MTKLRNTKKGTAKKVLSVSLAVAMLATSNVPVWAAEFSDGTETVPVVAEENIETFTAEDTDVAPASEEATSTDYAATVSGLPTGAVDWSSNDENKVNAAVTLKADNLSKLYLLHPETVEYTWIVDGKGGEPAKAAIPVDQNNNVTNYNETNLTVSFAIPEFDVVAGNAGSNIALFIRVLGTNGEPIWSYTSNTFSVKKKALSDVITASSSKTFGYDGNNHTITKADITLSKKAEADQSLFDNIGNNYNISISGDTKNVTDEGVKVTITPGDTLKGYTGSVSFTYQMITSKPIATSTAALTDMKATLKNTAFTYTGKSITKVKATDIELVDRNTGAPLTAYLDVDANGYVTVETNAKNAGTSDKLNISLKAGTPETGNKNFEIVGNVKIASEEKVTVAARNLSDVNVTIAPVVYTGSEITINTLRGNEDANITYTDKTTGETLTLKDDVKFTIPSTDDAKSVGSHTVTLTSTTGNVTGSKDVTFNIVSKDIKDASFAAANMSTISAGKPYTGEAVTFTATELGALIGTDGKTIPADDYTISYENNINAGTAKLIITGKLSYAGSSKVIEFPINAASVTSDTVTRNESVEFIDTSSLKDYKDSLGLVVKANSAGKEFTLTEGTDYKVTYGIKGNQANEPGKILQATVTVTNPNFKGVDSPVIVEADITNRVMKSSYIKLKENSFTYTGKAIEPKFDVVVDGKVQDPGSYKVTYANNVDAGTATMTVDGAAGNSIFAVGKPVKVTYTISPADASKLEGTIASVEYTGYSIVIDANDITATFNGEKVNVEENFTITNGTNKEIGKGTVTLTPKTKNFTGTKELTFDIVGKLVEGGTITVYDSNKLAISDSKLIADITFDQNDDQIHNDLLFKYDGTEKTFSSITFEAPVGEKMVEGTDYEFVYVDNISGKSTDVRKTCASGHTYHGRLVGRAALLVVAKGNYGSEGVYTDAEGNKIKNVVAVKTFDIEPAHFDETNITVKNGVYAGGFAVKPEVSVVVKGKTLVEGKDYKLHVWGDDLVNATDKKVLWVEIEGINGYYGSGWDTSWAIDKFDLANADVAIEDGKVVVKCGSVIVSSSEYTTKANADGTTTITAAAASKNYTGSKVVNSNGLTDDEKPETPMLVDVKVVGNKVTAVLSGESDGATGYDYVISKDINCITSKDYDKVNKNILTTETDFTYVQQGTYYAYCHAWKRVNGKKVFSDWSNVYPFTVSAVTPDQPAITDVTVSGSTVKVTYTKAANATGYDVVLGSAVKKVAGESRPVNYGTLVKKNVSGDTVTVTFKNVPKGTYYAGLHAFNRTSADGKKVFSTWSNAKTVTVK